MIKGKSGEIPYFSAILSYFSNLLINHDQNRKETAPCRCLDHGNKR